MGSGGSEWEVAPVCSGMVSATGPPQAHSSSFTERQGKKCPDKGGAWLPQEELGALGPVMTQLN